MTGGVGRIDRRRALQWLAAFGAALAAGGVGEAAVCPGWLTAEADGLRALGREYLAQHPSDLEVDRVWSLISSDRPAAALADVQRRARADYETGQLVRLSGWFVSVTEARIFAAVSTRC